MNRERALVDVIVMLSNQLEEEKRQISDKQIDKLMEQEEAYFNLLCKVVDVIASAPVDASVQIRNVLMQHSGFRDMIEHEAGSDSC